MRALVIFILSTVICVVHGTPALLAYSTKAHFLCHFTETNACETAHPTTLSTRDIEPLLQHLMTTATPPVESSLPLGKNSVVNPPELVILVHSVPSTDLSQLLRRVFDVAPSQSASSFHGSIDSALTLSHVDRLVSRILPSVSEFSNVAADPSETIFNNGMADLIALPIGHAEELPPFISSLRAASNRAGNNIAVVFAFRQGDDASVDSGTGLNSSANDTNTDSAVGGQSDVEDGKTMIRPNINAEQFAGLLVGLMFILIFVPGFMCLWRIQTPQTFAILDSNDMKKKIQ